jgi:NTP pyrophosphatase (non-canonical NTP hydrolase)
MFETLVPIRPRHDSRQLVVEVGELARIMSRTYGDQSFKHDESSSTIADELADVFFVLLCIANQTGVDLSRGLLENLGKKAIRDANRHHTNEKLKHLFSP